MQAVPACRQALTFGKTYSNQERARNTLSLVGLGDGGVAHGRGHHPEQEAAIQRHCTNNEEDAETHAGARSRLRLRPPQTNGKGIESETETYFYL